MGLGKSFTVINCPSSLYLHQSQGQKEVTDKQVWFDLELSLSLPSQPPLPSHPALFTSRTYLKFNPSILLFIDCHPALSHLQLLSGLWQQPPNGFPWFLSYAPTILSVLSSHSFQNTNLRVLSPYLEGLKGCVF